MLSFLRQVALRVSRVPPLYPRVKNQSRFRTETRYLALSLWATIAFSLVMSEHRALDYVFWALGVLPA